MDIFVLDKSFNRTALIDIYDSFIWTDRYYDCGDFELVVPANEKMLSILKKDLYLSINGSEFTMIIEGIELKTSLEEGNELIITGRDLTSILDRRIVWQQTQCNGDFQNQIKKLLNENLISPTDSARRIPNLIFQASTDPKITSLTVDTQFTGDNIFESIKKLCKHERVGFKITLNANKQMVFKLYMGVDRTFNQTENTAIEFSPRFDNLLNTDYVTSNKPYKNVTLIGGEGEGAERRFSTLGDATGLDRREIFTDARSVSSKVIDDQGNQVEISDADYNSQLQQKGQETLTKNIAVETFNGEVNANVQWLYGRDYYLGDIVQIRNEYGTEGTTRIIEVIRCDDTQNGLQTYPTFKSDVEDEDEVSGSTGTTTGGGSGTSYDPSTTISSKVEQNTTDISNLNNVKSDKVHFYKKTAVHQSSSTDWEYTGLSITCPTGHVYIINAWTDWNSGAPKGLCLSDSISSRRVLCETFLDYQTCNGTNGYVRKTPAVIMWQGDTAAVWEKRETTPSAENQIQLLYVDITL